jgi:ABC-type lipoprotein release transport system permease subunit
MRLLPFHYAARNIGRSPLRLWLTAGGSAIVVFLVVAAVASMRALDRGVRASGTPGNVMLLGAGSEESVERSEISASTPGIIAASVEGVRSAAGAPFISPELHVPLPLRREGTPAPSGSSRDLVLVRGVEPAAFLVHPQVRLACGRVPDAGADEAVIGRALAARLGISDSDISASGTAGNPVILIDDRPHRVTGIMDAPGIAIDGEAWMPITDLLVHTRRATISTAVVSLGPGSDVGDLEVFAARRPDLELSAIEETAYYAGLAAFFGPVRTLVGLSALLVAAGAMLGGLNALDAAFAARAREIAMLQVLGFRRAAVVASLIQESLITVAAGSLPAIVLAALLLDGTGVQFSMGIFSMSIDAACVAWGLVAAAILGIVGSLPPAIRCMRTPIPQALKSDLA